MALAAIQRTDGIGETGVAALPCCLAVAWAAARKGYMAGGPVLIAASTDDSRRAALVLSQTEAR